MSFRVFSDRKFTHVAAAGLTCHANTHINPEDGQVAATEAEEVKIDTAIASSTRVPELHAPTTFTISSAENVVDVTLPDGQKGMSYTFIILDCSNTVTISSGLDDQIFGTVMDDSGITAIKGTTIITLNDAPSGTVISFKCPMDNKWMVEGMGEGAIFS